MQLNFNLNQFARHRKDYLGRTMRSDRFRYVRWTDSNETLKVAKRAEYASELERLEQWLPELQGKVSSR